jgi:hypothetical protein
MISTDAVIVLLSAKSREELKNLLENKHLYQHVKINAPEILKQQIDAERQQNLNTYLEDWGAKELPKMRFVLAGSSLSLAPRGSSAPHPVLTLVPPNARIL